MEPGNMSIFCCLEMLPEENTERQSDFLHPDPHKDAIKVRLHKACFSLLKLKRVQQPDGKVEDAEIGDGLCH